MTPEQLAQAVREALVAAVGSGQLSMDESQLPLDITVERPRSADHGDYATNIAMRLAKLAGQPPRAIAEVIAAYLRDHAGITRVAIAGPGFLNITFDTASQGQLAADVVFAAADYGKGSVLAGKHFNVEFISANPTGPLHLGHTRWAAVGDAIAAVLSAAGASVDREFYVNDRGIQLDLFGASLAAAAQGAPIPKDGYKGGYVAELASDIAAEHPEFLRLSPARALVAFRDEGYRRQLEAQRAALEAFHTHFQTWVSERELHVGGGVQRALTKLREQGHVYELDGAEWLRTTDFGDDKDRVLIKADGNLTYFASDCAYYIDKRARGFDVCIYLLGADHHGYVARLKAVAACAGDDPNVTIEVLIGQLVKTMRDGREVRLSKRAGEIVTLSDLVDEVGVDAARYTLIRYPADSPLTLDLDMLIKRTNDNPVYYVQYAHARISSVLRNADELGIDWRQGPISFDPGLLRDEREGDLLGAIGEFGRVLASAAELREPHRVARYLEDLANAYHRFYDACRVLPRGDEELTDIHIARLWLCAAARQTLFNGLTILAVSAPDRM